jgi:hypothetical protein
MQTRNRKGVANPMYNIQKSEETIKKLQKLVYVYSYDTKELIGVFPTVYCSKFFGIGKDTLSKYLNTGTPYKKKLFYRKKK